MSLSTEMSPAVPSKRLRRDTAIQDVSVVEEQESINKENGVAAEAVV
jgi:hypothetical protein